MSDETFGLQPYPFIVVDGAPASWELSSTVTHDGRECVVVWRDIDVKPEGVMYRAYLKPVEVKGE